MASTYIYDSNMYCSYVPLTRVHLPLIVAVITRERLQNCTRFTREYSLQGTRKYVVTREHDYSPVVTREHYL